MYESYESVTGSFFLNKIISVGDFKPNSTEKIGNKHLHICKKMKNYFSNHNKSCYFDQLWF